MSAIEPFVGQFEHEMQSTRNILSRVPEADFAWKPHEKSYSLGQLASHIAEIPSWVPVTVGQDEFVINPGEYKPWHAKDSKDLVETFDKNVAAATGQLAGLADDKLTTIWTMKSGDRVLFQMPRIAVLRAFILSHLIHHRGQLTVYLRLRDIPVPQTYGPTADEPQSAPK
jgi:uncharacterized damage-inducible protein DinB